MSRGPGRAAGEPARALFIADLHLTAQQPARTDAFLAFLEQQACTAQDLYVLGDLFDAWIGDLADPLAASVCVALARLSRGGTRVWLMPGNRDFLLDPAFAARAGATLLPDPVRIELDGTAIALCHGDLLCTADHAYQRLRRVLRWPPTGRLMLGLPLAIKRALARALRAASRRATARKPAALTDATPSACEAMLQVYRCAWLIHGHTHRPARHRHDHGTRLVLGAWDEGPWVLDWPALSPYAPPASAGTPPSPRAHRR